jgi:hypothetical protein
LNPPNLYNEYILTIKCMIVKTILYPGKWIHWNAKELCLGGHNIIDYNKLLQFWNDLNKHALFCIKNLSCKL